MQQQNNEVTDSQVAEPMQPIQAMADSQEVPSNNMTDGINAPWHLKSDYPDHNLVPIAEICLNFIRGRCNTAECTRYHIPHLPHQDRDHF